MRYVNPLLGIISAADDSVAATSSVIDANQLITATFQAFFSDTDFDGTVQVQMSDDPYNASHGPSVFAPIHWTDIPNASATITAGASGMVKLDDMAYRWLRVVVTPTTPGTGTVTVNMFALSF